MSNEMTKEVQDKLEILANETTNNFRDLVGDILKKEGFEQHKNIFLHNVIIGMLTKHLLCIFYNDEIAFQDVLDEIVDNVKALYLASVPQAREIVARENAKRD